MESLKTKIGDYFIAKVGKYSVLNVCPHVIRLIKAGAAYPEPSGRYRLDKMYENCLSDVTLASIERNAKDLRVIQKDPDALYLDKHEGGDASIALYAYNGRIADFRQNIPQEVSNLSDIIIVSDICANLLTTFMYCNAMGWPYVTILDGLMINGSLTCLDGHLDNKCFWDVLLFAERFFVPRNQVFGVKEGISAGDRVIGTLGLQKVTPCASISMYAWAIEEKHPCSLAGMLMSCYEYSHLPKQGREMQKETYKKMVEERQAPKIFDSVDPTDHLEKVVEFLADEKGIDMECPKLDASVYSYGPYSRYVVRG